MPPQFEKSERIISEAAHVVPAGADKPLSRRQALAQFVRSEIEQYKTGEIAQLSSNQALGELFGYTSQVVGTYLKDLGISTERAQARALYGRRQKLIDYAMAEAEKISSGEIERAATLSELAEQFGYESISGPFAALKEEGLSRERGKITSEKEVVIPPPSRELAWMIGILADRSKPGEKTIGVRGTEDGLSNTFKVAGERLFGINASFQRRSGNEKQTEHTIVSFNSTKLVRFFGDLRKKEWPTTVIDKHSWMLEDNEYMWGFLEGFFDAKGHVYIFENERESKRRVKLATSSDESANFIVDMLTRLGISDPRIMRAGEKRGGGVVGVQIGRIEDVQNFAEHINSHVPEKQDAIEYCRQRCKKERVPKYPDEIVVKEWDRVRVLLGHTPSLKSLAKLHREGVTPFDGQIYTRRFGNGSYMKARENLERIIREQEEAQEDNTDSFTDETQVFP